VTLSIVVLCWNDLKVIQDCIESIFRHTHKIDYEVIVVDNGSSDGSAKFLHEHYPQVRLVENGKNLGFARGNNVGIRASSGKYVLILNPDTIVHEGALDQWIYFAEQHPDAGAFGCRVLNLDGSYQRSARPFPSIRGDLIAALGLWPLAYLSDVFMPDEYIGWEGDTERPVDWQSGCCVMFRQKVLKDLSGFDEQFFYHCEEVDLCRRLQKAGYPLLFTPSSTITHLGGQSVGRFPIRFALEKQRSRYRYYYKHHGAIGARRFRRVTILSFRIRQLWYGLIRLVETTDGLRERLRMYRVLIRWNKSLDPVRFVESGEEPEASDTVVLESHSAMLGNE